eukprot:COSAG04_NODE_30576_length_262_cov_0.392638_1_plen_25_part_01
MVMKRRTNAAGICEWELANRDDPVT